MHRILALAVLLPCFAYGSNLELREMSNADQSARKASEVDWSVLANEDAQRRMRVREMLVAGSVMSAEDFYNAALIMQHGDNPQDFKLAFSLASISAAIDPDSKSFTPAYKTGKWLTAAAWDRLMMNRQKPQWYGTQFTKPQGKPLWELYQIDASAVTDEERKALGVMTRAELLKKLEEMNMPRH